MQQCPYCGASVPEDSRFCGRCGQPLYGASPHEPTARASANESQPGAPLEPTKLAGATPPPADPYQLTVPAAGAEPYPATQYAIPPYGTAPVAEPGGGTIFTPPPPPPPGVPEYPPLYSIPSESGRQRPQLPRRPLLIGAIVLAVVVVLAGVLVTFNQLGAGQRHPQLRVSSVYHVGTLPAGATGTSLQVSGEQFSSNSQVTFYLDGTPLTGVNAKTDSNGLVRVNVSVTDAWKVGQHTLTAADANNNRVQQGVTVVIVPQGQAHTPGPNGAPPDDASFKVNFTVTNGSQTVNGTFTITGHPDPAGGTVCASYANGMQDDGQPHTMSGVTSNGIRYQETMVATCRGTYRSGKISYEEVVSQDKIVFETLTGPVTCNAASHSITAEGSFVDAHNLKGTVKSPSYAITCDDGNSSSVQAASSTLTGQLAS